MHKHAARLTTIGALALWMGHSSPGGAQMADDGSSGRPEQTVVVAPAPDGEALSEFYDVTVNGISVPVYA